VPPPVANARSTGRRPRAADPEPGGGDAEPDVDVRVARASDLPRTALLHRRYLPDGFFARLGTRFLRRYHATFLAGPDATFLVAEDEGQVLGFLAGTLDNAAHYRGVVRRGPVGLLLSGVVSLLRDPRLAVEFSRTRVVRYARAIGRQVRRRPSTTAGDGGGGPAPAAAPTVAVLTHVAVAESARGRGAGRALVAAFTERARSAEADELRLVTPSGGEARRFYRRIGWRSRGTRRGADGTVVEEFVRRP
jgi:ribosomal protein S18 acetylase RimI-like enzyme